MHKPIKRILTMLLCSIICLASVIKAASYPLFDFSTMELYQTMIVWDGREYCAAAGGALAEDWLNELYTLADNAAADS